jgi:hypothetical protein
MPSSPPRAGMCADLSLSTDAPAAVDVLEILDLSRDRAWLRLALPLAYGLQVILRLSLPGGPEHTLPGEVLWSVPDPDNPGHFTGVRFTPPLPEEVLRLFVEVG